METIGRTSGGGEVAGVVEGSEAARAESEMTRAEAHPAETYWGLTEGSFKAARKTRLDGGRDRGNGRTLLELTKWRQDGRQK
jgi:hypothetical protein